MECKIYDIGCWLDWVFEELRLFFVWVFDSIMDGAATLFESLPAPDFLTNAGSLNASLGSDVLFYLTLFQAHYGLGIIVSAYLARFILRRIPIIG
jgi:hypothetical protein